jgi:hypothetical protein
MHMCVYVCPSLALSLIYPNLLSLLQPTLIHSMIFVDKYIHAYGEQQSFIFQSSSNFAAAEDRLQFNALVN